MTRSACIASASAVKSGRVPPMAPRPLSIGGSQPRSDVYLKPRASSAATAAMRCLSIDMVHLPLLLVDVTDLSASKAAARLSTGPPRLPVVVVGGLGAEALPEHLL